MRKNRKRVRLSARDLVFVDDSKKAMIRQSFPFFTGILYVIIFLVVGFIVWAAITKVDERVTAPGKIIPSSKLQVLQNIDGGIVSGIYVKEGQVVKKNQLLMQLDKTRYAAVYQQALAKYWALEASNARLTAEELGKTNVTYSQDLLTYNSDLATTEMQLFNQKQNELREKLATLKRDYELAKEQLTISEPLVKEGLISQLDLLKTQRQVNDVQGRMTETVENFRSEAHEQLVAQSAELASIKEALNGLKDRMLRTSIRSPVYGTVQRININTLGGVVVPGMDIIEIVPLDDSLLIEAKIKPADIGFIHINQSAEVKFTAYNYSNYGGLSGKVEYVSADTVEEKDPVHGYNQTYYKVLIRTTQHYLEAGNEQLPIIPGMTATVDIKIGQKSILSYLLYPILRGRQQGTITNS